MSKIKASTEGKAKKKPSAKQRVLKACPNAFCRYDGLYAWHVRAAPAGAILAVGHGSSTAAWRDAARNI